MNRSDSRGGRFQQIHTSIATTTAAHDHRAEIMYIKESQKGEWRELSHKKASRSQSTI